ncbi:hypothetical protein NE590_02520 [Blautia obeum]|uniref:hypothetical protein n=1 Tax=Blautia obeum TaxID=40520 RepID=UPI00210881B0|nr:hypothetical protein [Blautia obeum]MCQ4788736.1 hypothetical protein [Blautia obeum]
MARELNISLIIGIVVATLPVWQWDSGIEILISVFTITGITFGIILWTEDKKTKKKNPTAATVKVR